ncbi:hypothetical protein G3479_11325 [Shewanella baltica]|uniref:hypothetical protein n=1 Tax=Shewanella baltica TaxID=62322 RepID=UPI00217D3BBC|nr:hypothetical protein [Shewanella baltica]MCS6259837.1 hypothetical protein [Shewanella baltica]
MFDAHAHATSEKLVRMLANELKQEAIAALHDNAMSAHCDRSIAELNQLIIDYPESKHTWVRLIERWQEIKQKHGQRSAQDLLNAEYARLASTLS